MPWQNGLHFAADIFKCIFMSENVRIAIEISIAISLKFVPMGSGIGSDIGLVPTRRQAIIWTNYGEIIDPYMCQSASVS